MRGGPHSVDLLDGYTEEDDKAWERHLAAKLYEALRKKDLLADNIKKHKNRPNAIEETITRWSNKLRFMLNKHPTEKKVYEKWMNRHIKLLGTPYWPKAFCMERFCDKVVDGKFQAVWDVRKQIKEEKEDRGNGQYGRNDPRRFDGTKKELVID